MILSLLGRYAVKSAPFAIATITLIGCPARSVVDPGSTISGNTCTPYPQTLEKEVDILFVIDNSDSMDQEQQNLRTNFPRLIDALRSPKLGNKIPNVRIGITSTDLGAGNYGHPTCEKPGGDGGKLINKPRQNAGCAIPSASYIEYNEGQTNVTGATSTDPVEQVKEAFQCLANLGTGGCAFEAQLEVARLALDPKENKNPGFLRKDALLAVVWITDEDDCSAQNPQLFDPASATVADPLGPLNSFRCTEFGIDCEGNADLRRKPGVYKSCKPTERKDRTYLHKVSKYVEFFKTIKPQGRVILAAITGPTSRFEISIPTVDGEQRPTLEPSCQSPTTGKAVPAVRMQSLLDGDPTLKENSVFFPICEADYGPAMDKIAKNIIANLGGQCIRAPLLTASGSLACVAGVKVGTNTAGQEISCQQSCLQDIDCVVEEGIRGSTEAKTQVQKCPVALFNNTNTMDCGSTCPCWRIVAKNTGPEGDQCNPFHADPSRIADTPYGLQILRKGEAQKGTEASSCCFTAPYSWNTKELADLKQCK